MSEENKIKLIKANTGRIFSEDHKEKLSKAKKGKKLLTSHRKNISKAATGENNPMYGRNRKNDPATFKKVLMMDIKTKKKY
jgi:hypothetical protein